MLDEVDADSGKCIAKCDHLVSLRGPGRRGNATRQEEPGCHMDPPNRFGIPCPEFAHEGQKAAGMVEMEMTEHDVCHARKVDVEHLRVSENCVGVSPRVEQDAPAIDLNQSREAPFADR